MSTVISKPDHSKSKSDKRSYLSIINKRLFEKFSMDSKHSKSNKKGSMDYQIYKHLRDSYKHFVLSCRQQETHFSLTPNKEPSPFALCFAILGTHLLGITEDIFINPERVIKQLRNNLGKYQKIRDAKYDLKYDKPYLQLLTLTLSCLYILKAIDKNPLETFIVPYLPKNVPNHLENIKALKGEPQSGNKAMFAAILLIHAKDYLGIDTQSRIDAWVELHISAMNRFGFWGNDRDMTFLQFQNGYHQYEIIEYLNVDNPKSQAAAEAVESLMDTDGHYAPYPGGGGCYDYDAVSILTVKGLLLNDSRIKKFRLTFESILSEQNQDGGFAESHYVHPVRLKNIFKALNRIKKLDGKAKYESLKWCAAVFSPKHRKISTHWSSSPRQWNESDLWDSYFRILTLARIDLAVNSQNADRWRFVNYPGIGFHPNARSVYKERAA